MTCDDFKKNIFKFLDQELENEICSDCEAHVSECSLCQVVFENEKQFDTLIRRHVDQEPAPYSLREKVIDQLQGDKKFLLGFRMNPIWAMSAVFCVVFVLLLGNMFLIKSSTQSILALSVDGHMDFLRGGYPLEIETTNMDEALHWFEGKLNFAVTRPHLDLSKVKLVGARIIHVKDQKAAYFVFERDGHYISATVSSMNDENISGYNKASKDDMSVYAENHQGYSSVLCHHKRTKTGCLIVSDFSEQDLKKLMA